MKYVQSGSEPEQTGVQARNMPTLVFIHRGQNHFIRYSQLVDSVLDWCSAAPPAGHQLRGQTALSPGDESSLKPD